MDAIGPSEGGGDRSRLSDLAYREIKRLMLTLRLRPGEWYRVGQISERLGIGRTPVRDALHVLSSEGLVRIEQRLGVQIPPISMREFDVLIEARLVIEPALAEIAAARATEAEIAELCEVLARAPPTIAALEVETLMELDGAFHERVAAMSRNAVLQEALAGLVQHFLRFWFMTLIDREHSINVWDEHWVICGALMGHDGKRAAAATRDHVESFRSRFLRFHADAQRDPDMRELFHADDR